MRRIAALLSVFVWLVGAGLAAADDAAAGHAVEIEVVIAEAAGAGKPEAAGTAFSAEQIRDLEKQGKLDALARVRVSTIEKRPGSVQFGENVPVATSRSFSRGFGGGADREAQAPAAVSYTMQQVGTMVEAIPEIQADGSVIVQLQVERTRLERQPSADGEAAARSVVPPRSLTMSVRSSVHVPVGKTVVFEANQGSAKESRQTWVLVSANVLAGPAAAGGGAAAAQPEIKIFSLKNASAKELAQVVSTVIRGQAPLNIGVDERTNTLVLSGTRDDLAIVEAILVRLDEDKTP
jgi:type II secretory pathway component GspD/PulD (secretin)